jgi:hypothetical protein
VPDVIDLGMLYERAGRLPTYHRMAAEVVSAAVEDPPVCLATYGHPWVYCQPTTLITECAALGLRVEVFRNLGVRHAAGRPGTDIAFNGIRCMKPPTFDPSTPLQNDVACLIWQPTVALTDVPVARLPRGAIPTAAGLR